MNPITFAYTEFLFRPLFNLLVGITNLLPTHSVGLAIIAVTVLIRILLLPSAIHQARHMHNNQQKMTGLKDKLKEINEKFKDDQTKKAEATMKLYKEAGVNPLGGCLPLLIQLPILIALYRVFLIGLGSDTWHYLYSFVSDPQSIQMMFFGVNLGEPSLLLGIIAGLAQFFQMRYLTSATPPPAPGGNEDSAKMMASFQKNMMYIFPVMTVFIAMQLPSALALYWLVATVFAIGQQYFIKRVFNLSLTAPMA